MQPLYAFLWVSFGFGAVALLGATLLLPDFKVYLPPVDEYGNIISESETEVHKPKESENHEKTETQRLEEMKKLGM